MIIFYQRDNCIGNMRAGMKADTNITYNIKSSMIFKFSLRIQLLKPIHSGVVNIMNIIMKITKVGFFQNLLHMLIFLGK